MKELMQSIWTAFNGTPVPSLHSLLGGRLHYGKVSQDEPFPYGVITPVIATNADTFTEKISNLRLQVSVFSLLKSPSECWDLSAAVMEFFEGRTFEVVDHGDVRFLRIMEPMPLWEQEIYWAAHGEYRAWIQRQ